MLVLEKPFFDEAGHHFDELALGFAAFEVMDQAYDADGVLKFRKTLGRFSVAVEAPPSLMTIPSPLLKTMAEAGLRPGSRLWTC